MTLATEIVKTTGKPVFLMQTTAYRTCKYWEHDGLDPLEVGSCTILLDARKETDYSDGEAVGTVHDFSEVMGDMTQADANRRASYVASAFNGQPAFKFVGNVGKSTADIYTCSVNPLSGVFASTAATWVILFHWNGRDQDGIAAFGGRYPNDSNRIIAAMIKGTGDTPKNSLVFEHGAGTALTGTGMATYVNLPHILVAKNNNGTWSYQIDGVEVAAGAGKNNLTVSGSGTMYFGGFADDYHFHWTGHIGVLAHFNEALDQDVIDELVYELADDYGIGTPIESGSWSTPETRRVSGVKHNGTALTERTSVVDVIANPGSWYWDHTDLHITLPSNADPRLDENTVTVELQFNYGTTPKNLNGMHWEGILKSVPNLSLRIERDFSGVSQIGSGDAVLNNENGDFDLLTELDWDAGTTKFYMGFDYPGTDMAWGDYECVGTWRNRAWKKDDKSFTLSLSEPKARANRTIPYGYYNRTDYPLVMLGEVGRPIPIAYGHILGACPVCIDPAAKQFKLAGHAIHKIENVRMNRNNGWETIAVTTEDLSTATFTCSGWDGESALSVDFYGKASGGVWMSNAADIVSDLLSYLGETNVESTVLAASRAKLKAGENWEGEINLRTPSIYIDEETNAFEVFEKINKFVGSYLFVDNDGDWRFVVFEPTSGESLTSFNDTNHLLDFEEETPEKGKILTSIKGKYAIRIIEDWGARYFVSLTKNMHEHNIPTVVVETVEYPSPELDDVRYVMQRELFQGGRNEKSYKVRLPWMGFKILPADQVRLYYTRHGLDQVIEVMEVNGNLGEATTELVLGDLHGFRNDCGFIVDDAGALPARFSSLAGYGSGGLAWNKNWDAQIKAWAKQNICYALDENGFADPEDNESYLAGCAI